MLSWPFNEEILVLVRFIKKEWLLRESILCTSILLCQFCLFLFKLVDLKRQT